MRVLVSGGAGFIGSHVVEALLRADHQVWVVDSLKSGRAEFVPPAANFVLGDIRHPQRWSPLVPQVDVVIHLAAQVSVPDGEADPLEDGSTNLMGTLKMLDWAKGQGAREFRFASSAAVYGVPAYLPLDESAALAPLAFYGMHKQAAEWDVRHFCELNRMSGVVLRLANVYGPRQRDEGEGAVVAAFATALGSSQMPVLHGDGGQSRDFIFVEDVARAFVTGIGEQSGGLTLNIGTGKATTVLALWQQLARIAGSNPETVRFGPARPGDIRHSLLDVRAAEETLQFRAEVELSEGLAKTYAYFSAQPR